MSPGFGTSADVNLGNAGGGRTEAETTQFQQLTVSGASCRWVVSSGRGRFDGSDLGPPRWVLSILLKDGDPGPEARNLRRLARAA